MEEKLSLREKLLWRLCGFSKRVAGWSQRNAEMARENRRTGLKVNNPGILTPAQIREVREFWAPYRKIDPVSHAFFTEKTGTFDPAYLPHSIYYSIITPALNRRPQNLSLVNKGLFRMLLGHTGIKQPATLCRRTDGCFYDACDRPISVDEAINIIARAGKAFVKKAVDTYGGLDVVAYDSAETDTAALRRIVDGLGHNWIAQEPIVQCDEFNRLNPNSVNTLRIMSYLRRDGSAIFLSASLRMSSGTAKVDNGSSGGISCGVGPDGRLKDTAYTLDGDACTVHPLTGTRFPDVTVPGFASIRQQVCEAHARVPQFRLIAWDIAVDRDNEAVLIEINTNGSADIPQLCNGPMFGPHTREILDELFGIKK